MKRSSRNLTINSAARILLVLGMAWLSQASVFADSADPNSLLAFKKIFVEKVQDNVDGAFQAPVDQSYKEIFDRNQRFELVNDKGAADAMVRTALNKKTSGIDIEISLVVLGTGEIFSTDKSSVSAEATGKETGNAVKQLLKTALKRIPFYGTVTGRDGKELTFDIGSLHGLRKGDIIQISRVDNIKRHPLLKSIVDVQLVPVGSAQIDSVEDTIAFGHVYNEIAGEQVQKLYKVTAIEARVPEPKKEEHATDLPGTAPISERVQQAEPPGEDRPQIGYVSLGVLLGGFSSSTSQNSGGTKFDGGSFDPGFRLSSEIWLTKRWFADIQFGYSPLSYTQAPSGQQVPAGTAGTSSSSRVFGLDVGYKYLPENSVYGPQVYVKLGYYSFAWDIAISPPDLLTPRTYSGLNLGVGGMLPISSYDWGLMLNINVLLFSGLSEGDFKTGGNSSTTAANFFLGGYHYLNPRIAIRAGFQFEIYSADFGNGVSSTSQKVIGFLPSVQYYF